MLQAKNLDQFFNQIDVWLEKEKHVAAEVGRGLGAAAFNYIPTVTAQFSGDMAANWKYSVGSPNTRFEEDVVDPGIRHGSTKPFIMGDRTAVNLAFMMNQGAESQFTLGSKAYISNSASHDSSYVWKVEKGTMIFRSGNMGGPVANTMQYMAARYGGVLTPDAVFELQMTKIGTMV